MPFSSKQEINFIYFQGTRDSWYNQNCLNLKKDLVKTLVRSSAKIQNLYLNTLKSATKEILLIFPTNSAIVRQEKIGVIELSKQAAKERGVKVRILMPASELTEYIIQSLKQQRFIDVRYIEQTSGTKATILVVDRKVSLVMELRNDSKTTFVEAIGLSTRSNTKAGVLSYVAIFNNLWKQSELYQAIKESHEQLKTANQKLEINDKILNEFINIAAHELRNPIQPILGLSEVLKSKIIQNGGLELNVDEVCRFLDVIIRNARKLQRLTDDVLDISKIETDSLELKKETFSLKELMQVLVDDYKSQNNNAKKNDSNNYRNIQLSSLPYITEEVQNADRFLIEADRGRISQVISNLLGNALKFTNKDDTIYLKLEEKNTDSVREFIVSVTDTGNGIDPEIFPRLFTKFATKFGSGTGLGLFICKNIIEAHGGKIWAENNVDGKRGATFAFSLPLTIQLDHQQESMAINATAIIITKDIEEVGTRKKRDDSSSHYDSQTNIKRIFLVDDDYDHTVTFKVGLEHAGFEVDAYNDSTTALSSFKPDYYDLLLIDIKMPKIDGFELYEKIRKIDDKVIIWFITAYETYYRSLKRFSYTPKGEMSLGTVIEKPIEIDKLVKQIKKELD